MELLRLQLQFEKHRKDMHALKNRRLIADAKNTKALEEHKDALVRFFIKENLFAFNITTRH